MTYQVKISEIKTGMTVSKLKDFIHAGFEYINIKGERHEIDTICGKLCFYNESLTGWVRELEKAMRLDGRTFKQLKFVIDYLFTRDTDVTKFWQPNIQSGEKLRAQFDKLKHQIKSEVDNGKQARQQRINEEAGKL